MKTHISAHDLCARCARVCERESENTLYWKTFDDVGDKRNVTRNFSRHKLKVNLFFIFDQFFFHVFLFFAMGLKLLNILNSSIKQIKCLKIERLLEKAAEEEVKNSN